MIVFLNDSFVQDAEAKISVFDRSFLYGDGLFETIRVADGSLLFWTQHLERMHQGCGFAGIRLPLSDDRLLSIAGELMRRNELRDGILRITLSRGVGQRGYSPRGANEPVLVASVTPLGRVPGTGTAKWKLVTSSLSLSKTGALAAIKSSSKILQVLARAEADQANADEAILRDVSGHAIEGAASNLFWVAHGRVCTSPAEGTVLPGITRAAVIRGCRNAGITVVEDYVTPGALLETEGVFCTLSSLGVVEAASLDGSALPYCELFEMVRQCYRRQCDLFRCRLP